MSDFTSFAGFASHLSALTLGVDHYEHESLTRAAMHVQDEAMNSVGHYQSQSGPFAAWAPLAASTQADRVRQGFPADEPELRTGQLRDSIQFTVLPPVVAQHREAEIGSDDPVMVYQELGTQFMPARSILGGAAARVENLILHEIGEGYVGALMTAAGAPRLSQVILHRTPTPAIRIR